MASRYPTRLSLRREMDARADHLEDSQPNSINQMDADTDGMAPIDLDGNIVTFTSARDSPTQATANTDQSTTAIDLPVLATTSTQLQHRLDTPRTLSSRPPFEWDGSDASGSALPRNLTCTTSPVSFPGIPDRLDPTHTFGLQGLELEHATISDLELGRASHTAHSVSSPPIVPGIPSPLLRDVESPSHSTKIKRLPVADTGLRQAPINTGHKLCQFPRERVNAADLMRACETSLHLDTSLNPPHDDQSSLHSVRLFPSNVTNIMNVARNTNIDKQNISAFESACALVRCWDRETLWNTDTYLHWLERARTTHSIGLDSHMCEAIDRARGEDIRASYFTQVPPRDPLACPSYNHAPRHAADCTPPPHYYQQREQTHSSGSPRAHITETRGCSAPRRRPTITSPEEVEIPQGEPSKRSKRRKRYTQPPSSSPSSSSPNSSSSDDDSDAPAADAHMSHHVSSNASAPSHKSRPCNFRTKDSVPIKWNGDPLEWPKFIMDFESLSACFNEPDFQKAYRFINSLSGQAQEYLKHIASDRLKSYIKLKQDLSALILTDLPPKELETKYFFLNRFTNEKASQYAQRIKTYLLTLKPNCTQKEREREALSKFMATCGDSITRGFLSATRPKTLKEAVDIVVTREADEQGSPENMLGILQRQLAQSNTCADQALSPSTSLASVAIVAQNSTGFPDNPGSVETLAQQIANILKTKENCPPTAATEIVPDPTPSPNPSYQQYNSRTYRPTGSKGNNPKPNRYSDPSNFSNNRPLPWGPVTMYKGKTNQGSNFGTCTICHFPGHSTHNCFGRKGGPRYRPGWWEQHTQKVNNLWFEVTGDMFINEHGDLCRRSTTTPNGTTNTTQPSANPSKPSDNNGNVSN